MNHENYIWYKEHGICTNCRKNNAIKGITLCLVCRMDERGRSRDKGRAYRAERKEKIKERDANRYAQCKENGICVRCKKRKAERGTKCLRCYGDVLREKAKRRSGIPRSELPNYGICYSCCKRPIAEGKRMCSECIEKHIPSITKAVNAMSARERNAFGLYR